MADVVPLLTAAQLQQFIVQGYVIFDAGLTDEFNAGLASRLDSVETAAEPNPGNNILPDVPEIAHVVRAPAIQGALTSILGPHYTLQPHRFAHVNHPGARAQMQHRDSFYGYYKYRSHYPWEAILFYYPRAVELAMGPTALLPFSQYSHRHYKDVEVIKKIPAGTAILCHYNLWHRGTGNSHESNIRVMVKLQFARLVAPSPSWFPYATEDVDAGVFREAVDWASVYDQCYIKDAQKSATLALTPVFERVWRWLHGDHPECYASPPPTVEEEAQYVQLLPLAAPLREDKSNAAAGDDDEDMMSAPPPSKSPPPKKAQPKKGGANATPKPVADDRAVLGAVYRLASSPRVVEHLQSLFTSKAEGWWNGPMKAGDAKMPSIGQYIGMIGVAAVTHALGDGRREDVRDFLMKLSNDAALPVEARWCALHGVFAAPYHSAVVLRFVRSYLLTHAHRPTGAPRFVPGMLLERVVAEGLRTAVAGVGDSAVDSEYIALIMDATKAAATATIVDAQSRFTLMLSVSAALMSGALTTVTASAVANPRSGAKKKKDRLGFGGKARPARAATTSPPPAVAGGDELEEEEVDDGASVTSVGSTASSNKQAALRSAALDGFVGDVQRIASNDTNRYARGFAAALYAALAVAPLDSNAAPDERSHAAEVVMTTRRCPFTSPQSQFVEKSERW